MNPWIERHRRYMHSKAFSEETIHDRVALLIRLDRELPLGLVEATVEELEEWLAGPTTGRRWSRQTTATYYSHIVGFFRWAADGSRYPHLSFDPSTSLTRPRVPRTVPKPLSDEQVAKLLDGLDEKRRLYLQLAVYAGLRCCQISALDREDITEQTITVRAKGGGENVIPTHPEVWRAVQGLPSGPVARRADGERATPQNVGVGTAKAMEKVLRQRRVSLHRGRHHFATKLLTPREQGGAGANLRTVQELLGHASPSTTAIYTQITDEQRRLAVNALPIPAPALW
jgi:integrase/recombinase XerC